MTETLTESKTAIDLQHLWKLFKERGDLSAERELIEHFLPLVDQVVGRIAPSLPSNINKDDLRSYGIMGLIDAVRKFSPERGHQFVTYGTWRIRGSIIDGLRDNDWLPRSLRDKAKKIEEAYAILEQEKMGSVSDEEVCAFLGISIKELHKTLQETSAASFFSLDEPILDEENQESSRQAFIEDDKVMGPEEAIMRLSLKETLMKTIERLPEKEKLVVSLFYFEELTLTEIAEIMNLSTSRISQLHSKAIFRLRSSLGRKKQ